MQLIDRKRIRAATTRERPMKSIIFLAGAGAIILAALASGVNAHDRPVPLSTGITINGDGAKAIRADSHAPIGVMGDHMHKAGEWMLSYRFMRMEMEDNRIGTNDVSPEEIVTTEPNRFFGQAGQPQTLRIVPTDMTMDMHMLGAMYAPTDWMTLMAMVSYMDKSMTHITFMGPTGTTRLGTFSTNANGLGDTTLTALIKLYGDDVNALHLNAGISIPTGSTTEKDNILTPMNTHPEVRLPYAMQLGSGTFDLKPGLTYKGHMKDFSWGGQTNATLRLGDNNGYSLGNIYAITAWGSYQWAPWISTSLRVDGQTVGKIDGQDKRIVGPVQTADPDNYGGDCIDLLAGVNFAIQNGALRGHRLALEGGIPVYQDLHGPQMKTDYLFTLGWQYAF
jgi:hypothetical protein